MPTVGLVDFPHLKIIRALLDYRHLYCLRSYRYHISNHFPMFNKYIEVKIFAQVRLYIASLAALALSFASLLLLS